MKKISFLFFIYLFAVRILSAQTSVDPGDNTLSAAISAASAKDVLVLSDGGLYTESELLAIPIDKPITIKAEDGAVAKPVIKTIAAPTGAPERPFIFMLMDGGGIILDGIEIDGGEADTTSHRSVEDVITFEQVEGSVFGSIEILNCWIHGVNDYIIGATDTEPFTGLGLEMESLIIQNSLLMGGDGFSPGVGSGVAGLKFVGIFYIEMTNTTVWHMADKIIRTEDNNEPFDSDPVIVIDHCTMHDQGHRFFQFRDGIDAPIVVTNSIFSDNSAAGRDREAIQVQDNANVAVTNCCFFNITNSSGPLNVLDEAEISDNIEEDPLFVDPANADFTLGDGSPCIGAANDGTAMGDPRWDPTTTAVESQAVQPSKFTLAQNYPNPFNPSTTIQYSIDSISDVRLEIHNVRGQLVKTLVNNVQPSGSYEIKWNAMDETNVRMPSGLYFYKLDARSGTKRFVETRKMILMK